MIFSQKGFTKGIYKSVKDKEITYLANFLIHLIFIICVFILAFYTFIDVFLSLFCENIISLIGLHLNMIYVCAVIRTGVDN